MGRIFAFLAISTAALTTVGGADRARAAEPVEEALAAWVASIDATDFWAAHYQKLAYDPATATATMTGLSIKAENGAIEADWNSIAVAGYAASPDGGFSATMVKAEGGTVAAGPVNIAVSDIELDDVGVPGLAGFTIDPEHPFTSAVKAYAEALKAHLAHGRIGEIAILEQLQGVVSRISYAHVAIDGVADGKIANFSAGPLKLESPSPEGLVDMSIASVESHDVDLGAVVRVLDPDQYAGGVGDGIWHSALRLGAYSHLEMNMPGAKLSIAKMAMENIKVRQPKQSFTDFFDLLAAHPDMAAKPNDPEAVKPALGFLSAFGLGRFSIEDVNVQATGIDRMRLKGFHIADLSSDGLGEFALEGIDAGVSGQGSLTLGRFAFGGVTFPGADALLAAFNAESEGANFDPRTLIPTLGFIETVGLAVDLGDQPPTTLDRARMDFGKYIGIVPTSVTGVIEGLDIDAALLGDAAARATFAKLGYDRLHLDYGLKLNWHEANESLTLDDFHVAIKDMGTLDASLAVTGLTRAAIEDPDHLGEAAAGLSFTGGEVSFTDASIVEKGLGLLAAKMKSPPEKFRQQFADALPFLLSISALNDPILMKVLRDSGLLAKLTPVIKTFVAKPGSVITVTAAPATPVPIAAITAASNGAPETLPNLLGISVANGDARPQ